MVKVLLVLCSSLITSPPLSSTSCGTNTTLRDPRRVEPASVEPSENVMVASGQRSRGSVTMVTRGGYVLTCSGAVCSRGVGRQPPGHLRGGTCHKGHSLHRRRHGSYKRVFLNSCLIAHLLTTDINRMEWYGFPLPSLPRGRERQVLTDWLFLGRQRQVLTDWLFWECYECTCMWKNCQTAGNPL